MKEILRIAQKGLILNTSKDAILVIKYLESIFIPDKVKGRIGLPGGQIEFGEEPDSAFVREVQEETGITITPLLYFLLNLLQQILSDHFFYKGDFHIPIVENIVAITS
ncbi:MAG: NUDIX domain-containing protein [Candidatus Dojkabacteria bacterium]